MFTTRQLTGDRVLVQGTDVDGTNGKTILDSTQWTELAARTDVKRAQEDFDAAVEEFFAPLMEAAEAANKSMEKPTDSAAFVVLDEGQVGQASRPAQVVSLTRDSIILRLIEEGNTDRLIWVGDELEVLEVLAGTHQSPASGNGDPHANEVEPNDDPV
jgi:hypothetical protein